MTPNEHATFFQVVTRLQLESEVMGTAYELCEAAIADDPSGYARAQGDGSLARFFQQACARARQAERQAERQHVLTDASGEGLGEERTYALGSDFSEERREVVREAWRIAHSTAAGKMRDYLAWFERHRHGETSQAIAESLELPGATVRTGLRRAKQRIVEITNGLRHTQAGRRGADLSPELDAIVAVYRKGDLVAMRAKLGRLEATHREDAHWCLLMAWYFKAREESEATHQWLREALLHADEPRVRAKILNTLGNVLDAEGQATAARRAWTRAHQLDPKAPVPLLNLLAHASERKDLADCQYYLQQLSELRARRQLAPEEEAFVLERLAQNPEFAWVRRTDPWRRGPMRWLKQIAVGARGAAATVAALLLVALLPSAAGCDAGAGAPAPYAEAAASLTLDVEIEAVELPRALDGLRLVLLDADGETLLEAPVGSAAVDLQVLTGELEVPLDVLTMAPALLRLEAPGFAGQIFALRWRGSAATLEGDDGEPGGDEASAFRGELALREEPDDEAGKDDYIRPLPTKPEPPGGQIGKDDYIRPIPVVNPHDGGTLSKDDYIQPKPHADDGNGGDDGDDGDDERGD